jgi:hypothetical protein
VTPFSPIDRPQPSPVTCRVPVLEALAVAMEIRVTRDAALDVHALDGVRWVS